MEGYVSQTCSLTGRAKDFSDIVVWSSFVSLEHKGRTRLVKKLKRYTAIELRERMVPLVITWRRLSDSFNGL
jgi:hypothetical protein